MIKGLYYQTERTCCRFTYDIIKVIRNSIQVTHWTVRSLQKEMWLALHLTACIRRLTLDLSFMSHLAIRDTTLTVKGVVLGWLLDNSGMSRQTLGLIPQRTSLCDDSNMYLVLTFAVNLCMLHNWIESRILFCSNLLGAALAVDKSM